MQTKYRQGRRFIMIAYVCSVNNLDVVVVVAAMPPPVVKYCSGSLPRVSRSLRRACAELPDHPL